MADLDVRRRSASASQNTNLDVSSNMSLLPQSNITPSSSYATVFKKSVHDKESQTHEQQQEGKSDALVSVQKLLELIQQCQESVSLLQKSIKIPDEKVNNQPSQPSSYDESQSENQRPDPSQSKAARPESPPSSSSLQTTNIISIIGIVILVGMNISIAVAVYNNDNTTTTPSSLTQPIQSSKRCSIYENHF